MILSGWGELDESRYINWGSMLKLLSVRSGVRESFFPAFFVFFSGLFVDLFRRFVEDDIEIGAQVVVFT